MKNNESVTNVARVRGSSCVGSDTFSSELNHIAHLWTFLSLITFPTLKTHFFSAVQIWSFPSYLVFIFTCFQFVDYIAWTALSQLQMIRRATCVPSTTELCLRVPTHMPFAFKLTEGSFSSVILGLQWSSDGTVHQWRYARAARARQALHHTSCLRCPTDHVRDTVETVTMRTRHRVARGHTHALQLQRRQVTTDGCDVMRRWRVATKFVKTRVPELLPVLESVGNAS